MLSPLKAIKIIHSVQRNPFSNLCQPWSNLQQLFPDTWLHRQGQREVSLTTNIRLTLKIRIFQREVFQEPNPGCVNIRDHLVVETSSASDFKLLCIHLDITIAKVPFSLLQFPSWCGDTGSHLNSMDSSFRQDMQSLPNISCQKKWIQKNSG